ncbi:hypothetical protein [Carboxylicivirga sp. M1479]|uniref:hypothetical protein n=1 Tax=Carboxylicivirga sp. M1479 TaxID=2594476 RepID=UPI0011780C26|nr:hypothetical protein [Carboxylicivirga sp. M1479]TRX65966.1 hypothetical protein FNN09_15815 [Carboxylicivirga sp. M1479]
MIRVQILFLILTITMISCSKDEIIIEKDVTEVKGVWTGLSLERYNSRNELTSNESHSSKLSFLGNVLQEMRINQSGPQYLMYMSYEFDKGILTRQPDSLIDIYKNVHYWNKEDSTFIGGNIYAKPFESSLKQRGNNEIVEYRVTNDNGQIKIGYLITEEENVDLKQEFEKYCNDMNK